jgi:hypothetical protein
MVSRFLGMRRGMRQLPALPIFTSLVFAMLAGGIADFAGFGSVGEGREFIAVSFRFERRE